MSIGPQDERTVNMRTTTTHRSQYRQSGVTSRQQMATSQASAHQPAGINPATLLASATNAHQTETHHLKTVIMKLTKQLEHYQHLEPPLPSEIETAIMADQDLPTALIQGHLLGPLFREYEANQGSQDMEIKSLQTKLQSLQETQKQSQLENEELLTQLQTKTKELLKMAEDMKELTGQGVNMNSQTSQDDRDRINLLTEENHVMFEQVTLLRAHADYLVNEYQSKTEEASKKISEFDRLEAEHSKTLAERDNYIQVNTYLEQRLTNTTQVMTQLEESRKADQSELQKMREQLSLFQNEYTFYKDIAEKLELKQGSSAESIHASLRDLHEKCKDLQSQNTALLEENLQLGTTNRQLQTEAQRTQNDLKQIIAINDDFQQQTEAFREREQQYVELGREYREKLEIVKFERERMALKEEQFLRQVHKVETESKNDLKKAQLKYDSQLTTRTRDTERRVEDLEDKLNSAQDEAEEIRNKNERLTRLVDDQKKQIDASRRKEDSLASQYTKLIDELRRDLRESERQCQEVETRGEVKTSQLQSKIDEERLKLDHSQEKLNASQAEVIRNSNEVSRLQSELMQIRAELKAQERQQESLIRQFNTVKVV